MILYGFTVDGEEYLWVVRINPSRLKYLFSVCLYIYGCSWCIGYGSDVKSAVFSGESSCVSDCSVFMLCVLVGVHRIMYYMFSI